MKSIKIGLFGWDAKISVDSVRGVILLSIFTTAFASIMSGVCLEHF